MKKRNFDTDERYHKSYWDPENSEKFIDSQNPNFPRI